MNRVYLSLGTNLGDRLKNLQQARHELSLSVGRLASSSAVYETIPWGYKSTHLFYNQVVLLLSEHAPSDILERVKQIEQHLGRQPVQGKGYADRMIDIDILFVDNQVRTGAELTIPHPLLHLRRFVLAPLCEIAPDLWHPLLNKPISLLLQECPDQTSVRSVTLKG